jgi:hypothetical protein
MLVVMQQQLLNFFAAVRKEGEPWEWNFQIITKDAGIGTEIWTEKSMLIHFGLPANGIWLIEAHVTCSFQMKCATGFFAAHRTVNAPRERRKVGVRNETRPHRAETCARSSRQVSARFGPRTA